MPTIDPASAGQVLSEYLDRAVLPAASPPETLKLIAVAALFQRAAPRLVTQYSGILEAAGILDDTGRIDIDAARDYGRDVLERTGRVSLLGWRFGPDDIETLHEIASKHTTEAK